MWKLVKELASNLLAQVIVGLLGLVGLTTWLGYWEAVIGAVVSGYNFVFETTQTPNWVLGLLTCFTLFAVFIVVVIIRAWLQPPEPAPEWHAYKTDLIRSLRWRWKWSGSDVVDLTPFCRHCDMQVRATRLDDFDRNDITVFRCEVCTTLSERFEGMTPHDVGEFVVRFIGRTVRNGEYKNRLGNQPTD